MIFKDIDQIVGLIKEPYYKAILDVARKNSAEIHMYVTGEKLKENIEALPYFEKDELTRLRKKLSRTTKDIFDRLLAPCDKVFTALGGYESYGLDKEKEREFVMFLNNIRNGMTTKEWVHNIAFMAKFVDPMSLTYIEIDSNGNPYPTYKSTAVIVDYKLNGRIPEYVILELSNEDKEVLSQFTNVDTTLKYYRAVDELNEYFIEFKGEESKLVYTINHNLGYIPAKVNGDKYIFNSKYIASDLEPLMELVQDYFNDNSSKSLFKKYQMHAKEWSIASDCTQCKGEGVFGGEDCNRCNGTGREPSVKVAQSLSIPLNEDGSMSVPTPPMGYVVPPTESWQMINEELERLKKDIYDTFYDCQVGLQTAGINYSGNNNVGSEQRTATEVILNEKHKEPTLKKISVWAADIHKFIADCCKKILYNASSGSSVSYGNKFVLYEPQALMETYITLKREKAPITLLDDTLMSIYDAEYTNNPLQLKKHIILMGVEPLIHNSLSEVMEMNVSGELKYQKLAYSDWVKTKTDGEIILSTEDELRKDFYTFVSKYKELYPIPSQSPK